MSQKERDQLYAEFSILSSLRHEHIVGYYHREHLKQTQELYLYMEYCGGGDLGMVIKNLKKTKEFASEEFVWRVFSQLVTALYRCHYGIDAPEPGSDLHRQKDPRLALKAKNQAKMILHRDLKPENIFLGEDQSVKLGDFGLSKLMQSHDFASTYVGTPFYMSPEICAAEKYTLQSDIWSVGCIMYELCTHEPPFNANSHIQLVQRIRKGEFKPLPNCYSIDLANVITNCLKTNPLHRPDTASLLGIPQVWIARKSQEVVQLGTSLKSKEEVAEQKLRQAEERLATLEADRATMRAEIDATVRREWEVKARLEIDRQVQMELEKLRNRFDREVDEQVTARLASRIQPTTSRPGSRSSRDVQSLLTQPALSENINPQSSVTTASGEEEFSSTTDLTDLSDLSIHSPDDSTTKPLVSKKTKTPFTRSKTTFDSPADIQMSEPSPMSISSLALSPRRNAAAQAALTEKAAMVPSKNIFTDAARVKRNWEPILASTSDDEDEPEHFDSDDDEILDLASPTRPKGISGKKVTSGDPFKMPLPPLPLKSRPGLMRQNTTAACQRLESGKPSLFPSTASSAVAQQIRAGIAAVNANSSIPKSATESNLLKTGAGPTSPPRNTRGLSKIPSRSDLGVGNVENGSGGGGALSRSPSRRGLGGQLANKTAAGRTLVELAQARAGGRPVSIEFNGKAQHQQPTGSGNQNRYRDSKELPPPPIWDVDILGEEGMPSPFLKRDTRLLRGLR